ncbi:unnamed protein product [Candidula unifasciata]|uniref:Uncharacterized protein n=1 Tax=Candidula unifasciata TaxID=100452 RepID=A0A8S3ZMR6_9EUPU|nr:unnamed protein product [Candidula unifasciata]
MLIQTKSEQFKKHKIRWSPEKPLCLPESLRGPIPSMVTITVIGDSRVGKSSLIRRFKTDKFTGGYKHTPGTEITQIVKTLHDDSSSKVCFHFLDTSDVFIDSSTVVPGMNDHVHASFSSYVLIVYDITDHRSFESAKDWMHLVRNMMLTDVTLVLVANKADLEQQRQVHRTAGQVFATLNGMVFVETSAKSGHNLKSLFNYVTDI